MTQGRRPQPQRRPDISEPLRENLLWLLGLLVALLVVVLGGLAIGAPQGLIMLIASALGIGSIAKTRSIWRKHRGEN